MNAVANDDFFDKKNQEIYILGTNKYGLDLAQWLIKTCKPKLAVCIYHNSLDFIRIPKLLLTLIIRIIKFISGSIRKEFLNR
jgi:hypothetical protein